MGVIVYKQAGETYSLFFRASFACAILVVTILSLIPITHPTAQNFNDKLGHALAYLVLGFLADYAFYKKKFLPLIFTQLMLYGLLIESVQFFLPFRSFSLLDMVANGAGLSCYILLQQIIFSPQQKEPVHNDCR